jgi:hypothetical protein
MSNLFDIATAQSLLASPIKITTATCVSGAIEHYYKPLEDLIAAGFSPCSTIFFNDDGSLREGSEPIPVSGVRFDLAGIDPVILASDHRRGLTPIVTIFDSDDDIVSFPVNIAVNGDVTVVTQFDVTGAGFVVVLR